MYNWRQGLKGGISCATLPADFSAKCPASHLRSITEKHIVAITKKRATHRINLTQRALLVPRLEFFSTAWRSVTFISRTPRECFAGGDVDAYFHGEECFCSCFSKAFRRSRFVIGRRGRARFASGLRSFAFPAYSKGSVLDNNTNEDEYVNKSKC